MLLWWTTPMVTLLGPTETLVHLKKVHLLGCWIIELILSWSDETRLHSFILPQPANDPREFRGHDPFLCSAGEHKKLTSIILMLNRTKSEDKSENWSPLIILWHKLLVNFDSEYVVTHNSFDWWTHEFVSLFDWFITAYLISSWIKLHWLCCKFVFVWQELEIDFLIERGPITIH